MNKLIAGAAALIIVLSVVSAVGLKATAVNAAETPKTRVPAGPSAAGQPLSAGSSQTATQATPGLASSVRWNKTYGGSDYDHAYAVQQTSDGGYILAGFTKSFGAGNCDAYLVKTDAHGNKLWYKTYGGSSDDFAFSVRQTRDGGYVLAGYTYSFGAGLDDAWLIKTDVHGNEQWNKTYGGSDYEGAIAVQQTRDGGYVLVGSTNSFGAGSTDAWLIKTNANGNEQWNKTYGGSGEEQTYAVQQTRDGGYVLAGLTYSFGAGTADAYLVKTDVNGNEQWNKTYGGSYYDYANAVLQTRDGGYVLAGYTNSFGTGGAWLIKTDSSGNKLWNKTYGGIYGQEAYAVLQTPDGGYVFAGYSDSFGAGSADAYLVKTDVHGNELWNKTYGGSDYDRANAVQQTSDGGYVLAGVTFSFGAGNCDAWLIKTDSGGWSS